jgi:hypothetical protein
MDDMLAAAARDFEDQAGRRQHRREQIEDRPAIARHGRGDAPRIRHFRILPPYLSFSRSNETLPIG